MGAHSVRVGLMLATAACAPSAGMVSAQPVDDFYCENSYTNFATGYQHHGTYVDSRGQVFAFGSASSGPGAIPWQPKHPESPTREELEEKYSHDRRPIGSVDARTLTEVRGWIGKARAGTLSKKVQRGADMGTAASQCWVSDAGKNAFRPVELAVDGDWSYSNTSPAAAELVRWLKTVSTTKPGS
jgi:hypothetical protein